jgi:hypothetical protein
MNWAEVRKLYLSSVGSSQAAGNEALLHLSEGQRTVSARLPLQETESEPVEIATTESQDYVDLPSDLYHVFNVYEKESGNPIIPEEGGMRGRDQYLEAGTGMPAEGGPPNYYSISGGRLYLRPTPESDDFTIVVRGKTALSDISESEYGDSPTLPEQYHTAIALAAALSFLTTHPDAVKEVGQESIQYIRMQLEDRLKLQDLPKDRERFDNRARIRLRGFRLGR